LFAAALASLFVLTAVACVPEKSPGGSGDPDTEREVVSAPIDGIDILIREIAPPQYAAVIKSGLPSGCARFNKAEIASRAGNTITIEVTNTIPTDKDTACTAIYGTHESTVELGTDFTPNQTYTLQVNDKTHTFTAQ